MKLIVLSIFISFTTYRSFSQIMTWHDSSTIIRVNPIIESKTERLYMGDSIWVSRLGYLKFNNELAQDPTRFRKTRFDNHLFNSLVSFNRIDSLFRFHKNSHYLVYLPDFLDDLPTLNIKLKRNINQKDILDLMDKLSNCEIIDSLYFMSGADVGYRDQAYLYGKRIYPKEHFSNSLFPSEVGVSFRFDVFTLPKFEKLIKKIESRKEVLQLDYVESFRAGNKGEVFAIKT